MESWRRDLLLLLSASFLSLLGFNIVFPFLPLYVEQLGIHNVSQIAIWSGLVISVASVGGIIIQPLWGYVADRHGRKPMFLRAVLGAGAALFAMAWVQNVWQLLSLRGVFGTLAGTNPAANALIAAGVPRRQLGPALGWLQTVSQLSAALGPLIGGLIAATLGLRGAFVAAGSVGFVAGLIAIAGIREPRFAASPRPPATQVPDSPNAGSPHQAPIQQAPIQQAPIRQAPIQWSRLVAPLIALVAMIIAVSLLSPTMPALAGAVRHEAPSAGPTGIAFGLLGLASAAGALTVGYPERWFSRDGTLLGGALIAIVGEVVLFAGHDWWLFLAGLVFLGLGQGLVLPMGAAMLAARSDHSRLGAVFGFASSVQSIGFAAGPLLGGALAASLGQTAVFPVGGLLLFLGAVPFLGWAAPSRLIALRQHRAN